MQKQFTLTSLESLAYYYIMRFGNVDVQGKPSCDIPFFCRRVGSLYAVLELNMQFMTYGVFPDYLKTIYVVKTPRGFIRVPKTQCVEGKLKTLGNVDKWPYSVHEWTEPDPIKATNKSCNEESRLLLYMKIGEIWDREKIIGNWQYIDKDPEKEEYLCKRMRNKIAIIPENEEPYFTYALKNIGDLFASKREMLRGAEIEIDE